MNTDNDDFNGDEFTAEDRKDIRAHLRLWRGAQPFSQREHMVLRGVAIVGIAITVASAVALVAKPFMEIVALAGGAGR